MSSTSFGFIVAGSSPELIGRVRNDNSSNTQCKLHGTAINDSLTNKLYSKISYYEELWLGQQLSSCLVSGQTQNSIELILPTLQHNYVDKQTILDPVLTPKTYQLPTTFDMTQEKLTPGLSSLLPIEDPHPLQKVSFNIYFQRKNIQKHPSLKIFVLYVMDSIRNSILLLEINLERHCNKFVLSRDWYIAK